MPVVQQATLLLALLLLSACAATSTPRPVLPTGAALELVDTPFFPQDEYQCGPAALATVLVASGVEATPEALVSQVYVPERRGSLQAEMMASARRHQRVPLALPTEFGGITDALRGGRPVLVLLNLGVRAIPVWHYAVVIGYDPAAQTLLLRSGRERRQSMKAVRFDAAWERAGRWALSLHRADAIPDSATTAAWIAAVAPFESLGQLGAAEAGYRAAVTRWPQAALPMTALGNVYAAQGRWLPAITAYSSALQRAPGAVLLNNRANALLELACATEATRDLDAASALSPMPAVAAALQRSRARVDALVAAGDARACPLDVGQALAQ